MSSNKTLQKIEISPLDPVLFRDGKPFNKYDPIASSIFPPLPTVYYGAIRAIYFAHHPDEIKLANNSDDPTKDLVIHDIFIKTKINGKEIKLYPIPRDCVVEKDKQKYNTEKKGKITRLKLERIKFPSSAITECTLVPRSNNKVVGLGNAYMDINDLSTYLTEDKTFEYYTESNFIMPENKIGIEIDTKTGTVKEGMLYRVSMLRFLNDTKLNIIFSGLKLEKNGLMKLGGEAKVSKYKIEKYERKNIEINTSKNIFKIYLATPAIFENGWIPKWVNKDNLEGQIGKNKVKLIAASVGRPIIAGGFDMKNKVPKPTYYAAPAGSVYYFRCKENCDLNQIIERYHGKSISDIYPEQGFGIAYIGTSTDC